MGWALTGVTNNSSVTTFSQEVVMTNNTTALQIAPSTLTNSTPLVVSAGTNLAASIQGISGVTSFTGVGLMGLRIAGATSTSDYSGIDFCTNGNIGNAPQARIAAVFSGGGSSLVFGTSNSYGSGITNTAMTIGSAGDINARGVAVASFASSQQNFLSNTTLTNTALSIASLPAGTYAFKAFLPMLASSTSGMGAKIKIAVGGTVVGGNTCAVYGVVNGAAYTYTPGPSINTTVIYANVYTANGDYTIWEGSFTTSTAGSFTVQMAQNVSTASNLTLQDRSYLVVTQLS